MSTRSRSSLRCCFTFAVAAVAISPLLVGAAVPDNDITYNVTDALLSDQRVRNADVTATTVNGIVTLTGTFDNLAAKIYAIAESKKVNGVIGVVDKLEVIPTYRSDVDISNAVRRRILNSAVIQSQELSVTCQDGVVTLSGTVNSYPQEDQAELLATQVRGVKQVNNVMNTKWLNSRDDLEIKNDAAAVLSRDVYLTGMPISVSVTGGVLSLTGSVGNAYERDRAADDVRSIENVVDVKNGLKVEWFDNNGVKSDNATPSDDVVQQSVRKTLDQDSRIDADRITIRTSLGEVTLNGTVGSDYEKRIAGQDAKQIIGCAWLNNKLLVKGSDREDWAVQDDVNFNLDTDFVTEGFNLDVNVKMGVATLTGQVNSWHQWSHAYDVASRVRGVKSVVDNIKVSEANDTNGTNRKEDSNLEKIIKSRLRSDWTLWWVSDKIRVTVHGSVATIEGDVYTWKERLEAGDRALRTSGISEVDNRLTLKGVDYPWDQHTFKLVSF